MDGKNIILNAKSAVEYLKIAAELEVYGGSPGGKYNGRLPAC